MRGRHSKQTDMELDTRRCASSSGVRTGISFVVEFEYLDSDDLVSYRLSVESLTLQT